MERLEELRNVFKDVDESKKTIVWNLIDEVVFLERQLIKLREYPLIKFHPKNPELQKITAAGKQYREFLQTYTNIIDKLCKYCGNEEGGEESPLRAFANMMSHRLTVR